jgi:hypothetical protein
MYGRRKLKKKDKRIGCLSLHDFLGNNGNKMKPAMIVIDILLLSRFLYYIKLTSYLID